MDKVQKIREEVEKLKSQLLRGACSSQVAMETICKEEAYNEVLAILDTMQEEPVSNPTPNKKMSVERWKKACEAACCDRNYRSHYGLTETRDDYFVDGVQWADEHPKEEPVSIDFEQELYKAFGGQVKDFTLGMQIAKRFYEMGMQQQEHVSGDLEKAAEEYATSVDFVGNKTIVGNEVDAFKAGAKWQKEKDESATKDLGDYISELSKQFPEVSFAKLSRIAVRVAKWQMAQMIKDATDVTVHVDAGGYPYIPQMELYDYDKDVPLAKEGDKYNVVLIKE